jgi:hypothetical protein
VLTRAGEPEQVRVEGGVELDARCIQAHHGTPTVVSGALERLPSDR